MSVNMTKCTGEGCLIKDACKRYYKESVIKYSSNTFFFHTPPFTISDGLFKCVMFWGSDQDSFIEKLKNIKNKFKR